MLTIVAWLSLRWLENIGKGYFVSLSISKLSGISGHQFVDWRGAIIVSFDRLL
jgi:hypothetical protein